MDEKKVAQWIMDTVDLFGGDQLTALRCAEAFVSGVRAARAKAKLDAETETSR
jgi:hypothetical protein